MRDIKVRPLWRHHGGKWRLAPWIIGHFPEHEIYVEPFCGAASVLFQKVRSKTEVLNDLDEDIVNAFCVLRDFSLSSILAAQIALTPYSRKEFIDSYLPTEYPVERARRTMVRNFMCYSTSGCRAFMTGFRSTVWKGRRPEQHTWSEKSEWIPIWTARLRGVVLECLPAIDIIGRYDTPKTLFYCDPPYVHSTRSAIRWPSELGRSYTHEMSDFDHEMLAAALHSIKGKAIISGYRSEIYDRLFDGWRRVERAARTTNASPRVECLWLSPGIMQA